jgi:hypothetical protein
MRIPSSPTPVAASVIRTEEKWLQNAPPEMQAQLKAQLHGQTQDGGWLKAAPPEMQGALQGHGIMDGGCFPHPPLPRPQDAGTRAAQGSQLHEIADGVRNGSITKEEATGLLDEQKAIANAQREAMADGHLSFFERIKLAGMQGRAERNIQGAEHNFSRDFFAPLKESAQTQASQIDQIANGRTNGNITNSEAGKLLGQQASISAGRDNGGFIGQLMTDIQQRQAQGDIDRHSRPGTQIDFKPFFLSNIAG